MSATTRRKKGRRDDGLVTVAITAELNTRVEEDRASSAPAWGLIPKRQFLACLVIEALEARQRKTKRGAA